MKSDYVGTLLGTILNNMGKLKDCKNCLYRHPNWRDGGHCYMFREEPAGKFCGQFKPPTEFPTNGEEKKVDGHS